MSVPSFRTEAQAQTVDAVFSPVPARPPTPAPAPAPPPPPPEPEAALATIPAQEMPAPNLALGEEVDLKALQRWLVEEGRRLTSYFRRQFNALKEQRVRLHDKEARVEQAVVLKRQKLRREAALVEGRAEALRGRDRDLERREEELARQRERLTRLEDEVAVLQTRRDELGEEIDTRLRTLAEARDDAEDAEVRVRSLRAEVETLERARDEYQKLRAGELEDLNVRRAKLEQRIRAIEASEKELTRREAELDEIDARLNKEGREREGRLLQLRRRLSRVYRGVKKHRAALARERATHLETMEREKREAAEVNAAVRIARAELDNLTATLKQGRSELDARETRLESFEEELEAREKALREQEAELAKERAGFKEKWDQREQSLAKERRDIEALGGQLRQQAKRIETELARVFGAENWATVRELLDQGDTV